MACTRPAPALHPPARALHAPCTCAHACPLALPHRLQHGALNNVSDLMLGLTDADKEDPHIAHALKVRAALSRNKYTSSSRHPSLLWQVRAALSMNNYTSFFGLSSEAPGLSACIMDEFADRTRVEALRVMVRSYQPSLPVAFVTPNLGFDDDAECAWPPCLRTPAGRTSPVVLARPSTPSLPVPPPHASPPLPTLAGAPSS